MQENKQEIIKVVCNVKIVSKSTKHIVNLSDYNLLFQCVVQRYFTQDKSKLSVASAFHHSFTGFMA